MTKLKNSFVLISAKYGWYDVEIVIKHDDQLDTLEALVLEKLGMDPIKSAAADLQKEEVQRSKIGKVKRQVMISSEATEPKSGIGYL